MSEDVIRQLLSRTETVHVDEFEWTPQESIPCLELRCTDCDGIVGFYAAAKVLQRYYDSERSTHWPDPSVENWEVIDGEWLRPFMSVGELDGYCRCEWSQLPKLSQNRDWRVKAGNFIKKRMSPPARPVTTTLDPDSEMVTVHLGSTGRNRQRERRKHRGQGLTDRGIPSPVIVYSSPR